MKCTEPAQEHAGKKFLSRALEVASYISHFLFLVPTKPCRGPTDEGNSLLTSACDSGSKIAATFDDRHAKANFSEFVSKFQVEEPLFLKLSEIAFENSIGQVKGSSCAKNKQQLVGITDTYYIKFDFHWLSTPDPARELTALP